MKKWILLQCTLLCGKLRTGWKVLRKGGGLDQRDQMENASLNNVATTSYWKYPKLPYVKPIPPKWHQDFMYITSHCSWTHHPFPSGVNELPSFAYESACTSTTELSHNCIKICKHPIHCKLITYPSLASEGT